MARGGKLNSKKNSKNRVRSKDKESDDSDEDFMIEDEENESDGDSEDFVLDGYASEESFDSFVEVEEEEVKKVVRSKKNKLSSENQKIVGKTSRKRRRVSYEEKDEEEEEQEEDEDYVNDDDDDDDDEEFTPDDDDCLDEEEEVTVKKKKNNINVSKRRIKKRVSKSGLKRRRISKVSNKSLVKKGRNNRRLRKQEKYECDEEDDFDLTDSIPAVRKGNKKNSDVRKKRYTVSSDSDFVYSGSSDYEFTISEEEREQVREACELYGDLKTSLRSTSMVKGTQENGDLSQQIKPPGRKGKEKVKEVKHEVGKQVCGICFSEEDKRRFRGTLNCCSHYFCFTCIMEWSKVESRCPLCKQRFKTITKNGRSTVGVDLRNVVIEVPKRDQVYQPSEEEIRSFIDPYENVICTECHLGGDDGLMLLCDLCDSPAHTYCVGLGQQVPEGNWYCDGCRPVALGSSSSQAQDSLPNQRTANNIFYRPSLLVNMGEGLDTTLESSPSIQVTEGFGSLSSPRFPVGDVQAASPISGAGAPTLSGRRQIQRHIQNLRHRMNTGRSDGIVAAETGSHVSNSQIDRGRNTAIQNLRTLEVGRSQLTSVEERLLISCHPSSSAPNRDFLFLEPSQPLRQVAQDPIVTAPDGPINLTLWPQVMGINSVHGREQFHLCNSMGSDGLLSSNTVREENQFYTVKEQLKLKVKSHLKNLSQDHGLGHDTFKEIARSSTHTILAACGLDHRRSEVHMVPPPSICTHMERLAAGHISMMKGCCSSCFDSFAGDVVKVITEARLSKWLSLGL